MEVRCFENVDPPRQPPPGSRRRAVAFEQEDVQMLGGTMRLGAYSCSLEKSSFAFNAYGEKEISERHRHRYEFNNDFMEALTSGGLRVVGVSKKTELVEIIELQDHPWFLGCQFHPEFKSSPMTPHPLFVHFIQAAVNQAKRRTWKDHKTTASTTAESAPETTPAKTAKSS